MNIAKEVASWSKDTTKVGAVIVRDRRILATGYNGFPSGVNDSEDRILNREEKLKLTIHAEGNALLNALKYGISVDGATIYAYALPVCHDCMKMIVQAGIKRVVMEDGCLGISEHWAKCFEFSECLANEAGVEISFIL